MDQNIDQNSIIYWIGKNFSRLEMTLLLAFMLGMMFKTGGFGPYRPLIGFGLTFLAVIYFLYAFIPGRQSEKAGIFMQKIMAVSWALIVVGIMFYYLDYPGFLHQLLAGLLALVTSCSILVISGIGTERRIGKTEMIRSLVIMGAGIYIFLFG